jgi:hypothetical protein
MQPSAQTRDRTRKTASLWSSDRLDGGGKAPGRPRPAGRHLQPAAPRMRSTVFAAFAVLLAGCHTSGMAGAARTAGSTFDRAECLARDFRGEEPCPEPAEGE